VVWHDRTLSGPSLPRTIANTCTPPYDYCTFSHAQSFFATVCHPELRGRAEKSTVIPHELLQRFITLAPEFAAQWNSDQNCFREDDGTFTFHGVCAEFSHFYRDNFDVLSEPTLKDLYEFIERNLVKPVSDETPLDNALCTCFLENISSEPCGEAAKPLMGRKSREFFDRWHVGPPY